ncbi:MAG: YicC family protein [Treponema sp.]|nr:YicC family protein [Treponema sp.]
MISMTGYAYRETCDANVSVSVEIRSYNSRYLDVSVSVPSGLSAIEQNIREYINQTCYRGKVDVSVRICEKNIPVKVSVNTGAARAYKSAIENLARELGLREKPGLSQILKLDGVIEIDKSCDNKRYWHIIEPVLHETCAAFNDSRLKEGKHTGDDIQKHLRRIEAGRTIAESFAATLEKSIQENMRSRFRELLGENIDENRVMAETAAMLVKSTISEEISRLGAHLQEFKSEMANNPHPGKKLDFLCQEINREINTIGSKCGILEVSHSVVDMKDALENIREQLHNVE